MRPLRGQGLTTEAGYRLSDAFWAAGRFETFGLATGVSGQAETLGVSYSFRDYYTKLQVAGSLLQNMSAVNGSPSVVNGATNQELTVMLQASI